MLFLKKLTLYNKENVRIQIVWLKYKINKFGFWFISLLGQEDCSWGILVGGEHNIDERINKSWELIWYFLSWLQSF